jgi:hypothetical protein
MPRAGRFGGWGEDKDMTLQHLMEVCGLEGVSVPDAQATVAAAYTSDLLSDVMAHCPDGAVLITVQNHKNTVAVCTLVGSPAILIVHNREVPADMSEVAQREGVALLRTADDQFTASCKIGAAFKASAS